MNKQSLLERFHSAMNRHNLDAFLACFASDYNSNQPIHPDRAFEGIDQVRNNWTSIFEDMPDFQGDLLRTADNGDTIWTEWDWHGTWRDGTPFHVVAAIIFGVYGDRFAWGRLYMDPVETSGQDAA